MPYKIVPIPGTTLVRVINARTREVKAKRTTMARAKAQIRLLEGIEHRTLVPRR